jgi:predicted GNAT family N-acyltransferase
MVKEECGRGVTRDGHKGGNRRWRKQLRTINRVQLSPSVKIESQDHFQNFHFDFDLCSLLPCAEPAGV